MLLTGLLSYRIQDHSPGVALPTMWSGPSLSIIFLQENILQASLQPDLAEAFSQVRFPQMTLPCVNLM